MKYFGYSDGRFCQLPNLERGRIIMARVAARMPYGLAPIFKQDDGDTAYKIVEFVKTDGQSIGSNELPEGFSY